MKVFYLISKIKLNLLDRILFLFLLIIFLFYLKNSNHLINKKNFKINLSSKLIELYTTLYDATRFGYIMPKFPKDINRKYLIKQKKGICLCTIGKNENLYIREFINYYYLLGIKKIIIYDNNDLNGERFENILEDYIKMKYVDIIDVRGLSSIQIPIYNYCYHNNKYLFDWIGFLDFDEYLYINSKNSINNYFYNKKFQKCEAILLNWMIYNDNDLLKYDKRKITIRFKYPKGLYSQGKSFVRGEFNDLIIPSTHIPGINIYYFCNSKGNRIYPKDFINIKIEKNPDAFIKHYYTKTVEEFCNKINKGNAYYHKKHPKYIYSIESRINLFFVFNIITKQKIEKLENCTNIKLTKFRKKLNKMKEKYYKL